MRVYRETHRDEIRANGRRYYHKHRAQSAVAQREAELRRRYGLTSDDYDALLAQQGGVCAICGAGRDKNRALPVDHDHATGRVRGLLCFRCNRGLGAFGDTLEGLMRAVSYLESSGAV